MESSQRAQPYTENSRQLRKAGSGRGDPQGRAHHLVAQGQQVSPENMHASNTMWTQQIIFKNVWIHGYIHDCHNNW